MEYKKVIEELLQEMLNRGVIVDSKRNRLLIRIIKMALGFIVELLDDDDRI